MLHRWIRSRIAKGRSSILLLGPRQVGKSTLCRSLEPDLFIDLADEAEFLSFAKDASRLRREVQALEGVRLVVIDEIQRVPALLNTVQSLIDQRRGKPRFVLTGSSARKLKRGRANLLPGRVVLERLDPLGAFEVGGEVNLERALRLGMLPGIYWGGDEAAELLGTYSQVYLREEILAGALARDLGSYARFLDIMAIASGQWINYAKLSSDTEIPKETLRRYVQLLEDTLVAFRIPAFTPRVATSRRVTHRERVFLFDVGVRNALLGIHHHRLAPQLLGSAFEQWVVLQVVYLNHALRKGWKLSSYRSEGGAEVDLIIEREADLIGIEVKSGRNVASRDTRGLISLAGLVGRRKPLRKWIVYQGARKQRFDNGVEAWPVLEALRALM